MKKELEVSIPLTPNFIRVGGEMRPLSEFEEHELTTIGELWTKELIKKSKRPTTN